MFSDHAAEFAEPRAGWRMSQDVVWEKHNGSSFHADRFRRVHESAAHFYRGPWDEAYKNPPKTPDATKRTVRRKQRPPHMGVIGEGAFRSEDGGPRLMRSVIYEPSCHGYAENETQKPLGIIRPLIEYSCPPGGIILDPFCGSGSTLVAAKEMGRRAIGMDIREDQCEIAARRLSQGVLALACSGADSEKMPGSKMRIDKGMEDLVSDKLPDAKRVVISRGLKPPTEYVEAKDYDRLMEMYLAVIKEKGAKE